MNNEIRNELLNLYHYIKIENEEDKKIRLEMLLESFGRDIKRQLENLDYKKQELEENLELLEDLKLKLEVKGDL